MKRKLFIILSLLSLALIGTVTVLPVLPRARLPEVVVDGAMRTQAIDMLVARLNQHYVFPDTAKQIETLLRKRQHDGKYDAMTNGGQFAAQLTADMASVAHDLHMKVKFSPGLLRPGRELAPPRTKHEQRWRRQCRSPESCHRLPEDIGISPPLSL